LITPKFKSTSSVFPAERTDLFGAIEGVSSQLKSLSSAKSLASLAGNVELDKYIIILKSGRVLGFVINKFDLVHVYDIKSYPMEKTTIKLLNNVDFSTEEESSLLITVYDEDPQRAADMANFFVAELSRTNTELQIQNARANRKFIEERYNRNLIDLAAAEDSLKAFQKKYGVIAMPEQTEASIKAAAEITGQLAVKEVQANVLRRTQSVDNPSLIAAQIEIDEFRNKLSQMNSGGHVSKDEINIFIPFSKMPDLGGEYVRRFREVEIQYKILQFITPIYEQAKVEEQRNTPSVVVLDYAVPAERKTTPKRLLIILGGFFVGLISAFLYAISVDRWMNEKRMNTSFYQSSLQLLTGIQSDYRSVRVWIRQKRK
jgi:capsule polysaccharide export protein KpsE/RkpR